MEKYGTECARTRFAKCDKVLNNDGRISMYINKEEYNLLNMWSLTRKKWYGKKKITNVHKEKNNLFRALEFLFHFK